MDPILFIENLFGALGELPTGEVLYFSVDKLPNFNKEKDSEPDIFIRVNVYKRVLIASGKGATLDDALLDVKASLISSVDDKIEDLDKQKASLLLLKESQIDQPSLSKKAK